MNAVGVAFERAGTVLGCETEVEALHVGERVVVARTGGTELATVIVERLDAAAPADRDEPSPRVLRRAEPADMAAAGLAEDFADHAFDVAARRIEELGLPMRLVIVTSNLERSRAVFVFTAPSRVDFRQLVRDLVRGLGIQVRLQQVGSRDAAKLLGGVGRCGQGLCCATHLRDFHPVSVKMAKEQDLGLSESAITGQCGRLKCCIAYELGIYREGRAGLPPCGRAVETPDGPGRVVAVKPLACRACVSLDEDRKVREYPPDELIQIQSPAAPRA